MVVTEGSDIEDQATIGKACLDAKLVAVDFFRIIGIAKFKRAGRACCGRYTEIVGFSIEAPRFETAREAGIEVDIFASRIAERRGRREIIVLRIGHAAIRDICDDQWGEDAVGRIEIDAEEAANVLFLISVASAKR